MSYDWKREYIRKLLEPVSLFNGLLVVFTVVLAVFAGLQWRTLEKTDHTQKLQTAANIFFQVNGWSTEAKRRPRFNIGNSGLVATRNLKFATDCRYSSEAIADPWEDKKQKINYTLGPKQTDGPIPACDEDRVTEPSPPFIYIFGIAQYDDTFTNLPRQTQFCFRVGENPQPAGDKSGRTSPIDVGEPCKTHNCTDDECKTPG